MCKLVNVHNNIMFTMDNKKTILLALLDLSVVFDTIDHDTLLHRLQYFFRVHGCALSWLKLYLRDNYLAVNISGEFSNQLDLNCGVA